MNMRTNGYVGTTFNPNTVNKYKFVTEAYQGSGGFQTGDYLFKFAREYDFESRKAQAFYENFTKGVADALYVPVYSELADRRTDSELFEEFINNADNNGNHFQGVMKTAGKYATIHGISFVVMDNFSNTPESVVEVIEGRLFPYIYVKTADTVHSYEIDDFGRLTQISFYDGMHEVSVEDKKASVPSYRYWDAVNSYKYYYDREGNKIVIGSEKEHNVGYVPIIAMQTEIDYEEFLPNPPFYDIARMNLAIFNGSSELNNLQRQQAFSLLVLPTNDQNPNIEIGANSVLIVDPQSTVTPQFISPDSAIMTAVQSNIESIVSSLLDSADSLGATAMNNNSSTKSGVAMSYTFLGQNFVLSQLAQLSEKIEYKIAEMFKLYTNTDFEYIVNYESNYKPNINDVKVKYEILERMIGLDISPAINSQLKSSAVEIIQSMFDVEDEDINKLRALVASENETLSD